MGQGCCSCFDDGGSEEAAADGNPKRLLTVRSSQPSSLAKKVAPSTGAGKRKKAEKKNQVNRSSTAAAKEKKQQQQKSAVSSKSKTTAVSSSSAVLSSKGKTSAPTSAKVLRQTKKNIKSKPTNQETCKSDYHSCKTLCSRSSKTGEEDYNSVKSRSSGALQISEDGGQAKFNEEVDVVLKGSGKNQLLIDQNKSTTAKGINVNSIVIKKMLDAEKLEQLRHGTLSADMRMVINLPFCKVDQIVPGLFLCGFAGTTKEFVQKEKINLLINVTWELGLLEVTGLRSLRVPVDDSSEEPINLYFNDVVDLLEANRRAGGCSVVHCMAGVSRSATLVLAYLVKYTGFNLHDAFRHLYSVRPIVHPNIGFFRQLINWEMQLWGVGSTQLVTHYINALAEGGSAEEVVAVQVPDFYAKDYPHLQTEECRKQVRLYVEQQQQQTE